MQGNGILDNAFELLMYLRVLYDFEHIFIVFCHLRYAVANLVSFKITHFLGQYFQPKNLLM